MNTNIKISLTEDERSLISNIYHNKTSSQLATRKEVTELVQLFIRQLIEGDGQSYEAIAPEIIKHGYKYFMNDRQVSAEVFHDPVRRQRDAEMGQAQADVRRAFFEQD